MHMKGKNIQNSLTMIFYIENLCGPTAMVPTPNRVRRCAVDELPTNFDLVESEIDQTLANRVWIKFRLLVWQNPHTGQEILQPPL